MKRTFGPDKPGLLPNRACRHCVQVKVKCIPLETSSDNICQRCHRLGKSCTTPVPVLRKPRVKSTRVTDLESRVNRLTALLTPVPPTSESVSSNTISQATGSLERSPERLETTLVDLITNVEVVPAEADVCEVETHHTSGGKGDPPKVRSGCPWTSGAQPIARSGSPSMFIPHAPGRRDGSELTVQEFCPVYLEPEFESKLFCEFRNNMIGQFPFVVIDRNTSMEVYKQTRPFSYWAGILAAGNRNRMLHQNLHDEMMKALGHRMLYAGGKNIDLLQGILLLIAWHHWISHYSPQLMNLLHLAQALLADLGIGKPVRLQDKIRIASDTTAMMHGTESLAIKIAAEEQRALLGCYYISSKSAYTFNRMDPMRFSQHIDECCKSLKAKSQYETDSLIVELVQLHRILGKYSQVDGGSILSSGVYRKMFEDEIQQYKNNLPPNLKDHGMLELEIYSGSMCILEPNYITGYDDKIDGLNAFNGCLEAGNKLTKALTSIPSKEWGVKTFMVTMSMIQLLVVFCRLSFFKSDKWQMEYAWRTVNFGNVLQQIKEIFDGIHRYQVSAYPSFKPWRFAIYARKAEHIRIWFEAKVAIEEAALAPVSDQEIPNTFSEALFGNFDDATWQDLMGDWANF